MHNVLILWRNIQHAVKWTRKWKLDENNRSFVCGKKLLQDFTRRWLCVSDAFVNVTFRHQRGRYSINDHCWEVTAILSSRKTSFQFLVIEHGCVVLGNFENIKCSLSTRDIRIVLCNLYFYFRTSFQRERNIIH